MVNLCRLRKKACVPAVWGQWVFWRQLWGVRIHRAALLAGRIEGRGALQGEHPSACRFSLLEGSEMGG